MAAVGGASGALLGGILTDFLSWRWIFYINIPIAAAALVAARVVLLETRGEGERPSLDIPGAIAVTGGLVALVYAVAGTSTHAWSAPATVIPLAISGACLVAFFVIETKVARAPLVPFRVFRSRGLSAANVAMLFAGGAMFSMWFFVSLYLQDVLRFSPLVTGVGFIPQTAAIALGAQISSRLVPRYGPRVPLIVGILASASGLEWLSHAGPTGSYWGSVFGGADLATFGMGLALTPLAFAATAGVPQSEAGLASGVLNTSRQIGASVALAALATIAADRTHSFLHSGGHKVVTSEANKAAALTAGFSRGFMVAASIALCGAVAGLFVPRQARPAGVVSAPTIPEGAPLAPVVEPQG
jgi:hypothetical protein